MAKNKLTIDVGEGAAKNVSAQPQKKPADKKARKKTTDKNAPSKFRVFWNKVVKVFREMISELKKVDWPTFKSSKNTPGVWVNTGTVFVVVIFFLIVITAFDAGLSALLKLLTQV